MTYEFRTTDGTMCCSTNNPAYLCDNCKARLAEHHQDSGVINVPRDKDGVPNPYAAAVPRPTKIVTDSNGVPDPYATALAKEKR